MLPHRSMLALVSGLLAACGPGSGPLGLVELGSEVDPAVPAGRVTFLPPLVPPTPAGGVFHDGLLDHLTVEVCRVAPGGCDPVARITRSEGRDGPLRLDAAGQRYLAHWRAQRGAEGHYRVRVLLDEREVASTGLEVTSPGPEPSAVAARPSRGTIDPGGPRVATGSPVAIPFRIDVRTGGPKAPTVRQVRVEAEVEDLVLLWDSPPGIGSVEVGWRERGTEAWQGTTLPGAAETFHLEDANDRSWDLRLRACNPGVCSDWVEHEYAPYVPPGPGRLAVEALGPTRVELHYTPPEDYGLVTVRGITYYQTRFDDDLFFGRIEQREAGTTEWTLAGYWIWDEVPSVTGLSPSTAYELRWQACDLGGCSEWSEPLPVTTPGTVALHAPA